MAQRIAMWSGPRNLSTAMMYSWGNRADCAVSDEPFYAAFLSLTGADHPMRANVLADQESDGSTVAEALVGPVPGGRPIWYQKHMCHHMVPGVPRGWMRDVQNVFLIRHPARVVASYVAKREAPSADDIGFAPQAQLFAELQALGQTPVVIDSGAIRARPRQALTALCATLNVPFDPAMLAWEAGPRAEDGIWAAHWYDAVHRSTGFAGAEGPMPNLAGAAARLAQEAMEDYEAVARFAIDV